MDTTPARPPKKRRRWLVVAFVLVLVSMVSWWHWPRGDARFVGKWKDSIAFYEFRNNGWGTFSPLVNGIPRPHPMRWWVSGEFVFIENWNGTLKHDAKNLILKL
jgi:hypothetical protein